MIRHHDGGDAFADVHGYYHDNTDAVSSWLTDASRAAIGVGIAGGATALVERRVGRSLVQAEQLALAWIVNVMWDIHKAFERHADGRGNFRDRAAEIGYNNAVGIAETTAIQHFTRFPTHVCAQIPVIFKHLHDSHF